MRVVLLVAVLLAPLGCDQAPSSQVTCNAPVPDLGIDEHPLTVRFKQYTETDTGVVGKQLGVFEASWENPLPLQCAAQQPLSYSNHIGVKVRESEKLDPNTQVFVVLREEPAVGRPGNDVRDALLAPGQTTVPRDTGAFRGTAYAFFVNGIGAAPEAPAAVVLRPDGKEERDVIVTADPKEHVLPRRAVLHVTADSLKEEHPQADQTTIGYERFYLKGREVPDPPLQFLGVTYIPNAQRWFTFAPPLTENKAAGQYHLEPLGEGFEFYLFMIDPKR